MSCTTLLVGKAATHDGSAIIARTDDSPNGEWDAKRLVVVTAGEPGGTYESVISHVRVPLPNVAPLRYTATPNVDPTKKGIWAEHGINAAGVAMTATETITTNERVLGADPLVAGGIGEEDLVTLVLPYVHSAREGVLRTGELLERHGTYEKNGIGFADADEVWWLETVGGHRWIARRLPDDCYAVIPNQLGIDRFDLADAEGEKVDHLASVDLRTWMEERHLALEIAGRDVFNPRWAFGSATDADHVYNTPRAWDVERTLNPHDAPASPEADDIPWCRRPERLLTVEDVKRVLSLHYQGTEYDPYGHAGTPATRGLFRPIGINRNMVTCALQLRPGAPALQWTAFGSNVFNAFAPFYADVDEMPAYVAATGETVGTEALYWSNRLIAALADARFGETAPLVERYQQRVAAEGRRIVHAADKTGRLAEANQEMADVLRRETDALLGQVLDVASYHMKNAFSRSDD